MKRFRLLDRRILLIAGVLILVLLMSDFSSRMGELRRLGVQKETVSALVTRLASTAQVVKMEKVYATSAAAVEGWAREDAHMIKPGDIPIQQLAPAERTPAPVQVAAPTPEPVPNWQVWYVLFFDQ
jgi:hypothetical protein